MRIIEQAEIEEQTKLAAAEKERKRLANLSNTGMWQLLNYVDEFGNKTTDQYATNKEPIKGTFSNSATQNSPLLVEFLIDSKSEVAIKLYEYAGDNPVKALSQAVSYQVAVLASNGYKHSYYAFNRDDRLRLRLEDSQDTFHKIFANGGVVKFRIDQSSSSSSYAFEIEPDGYENAILLLAEGNKK